MWVQPARSDFHKRAHTHTKSKHARVGAAGLKLEGENHILCLCNWAAERDARSAARECPPLAAATLHRRIYVMKDLSLACQVAR